MMININDNNISEFFFGKQKNNQSPLNNRILKMLLTCGHESNTHFYCCSIHSFNHHMNLNTVNLPFQLGDCIQYSFDPKCNENIL